MMKKLTTKLAAFSVAVLLVFASSFAAFAETDEPLGADDVQSGVEVGDGLDIQGGDEDGDADLTTGEAAYSGVSVVESTCALTDDACVFDNEAKREECLAQMREAGQKTGWQIIVHTSNDGVSSGDMESHYDRYYKSQSFASNAIMLVLDKASGNRIILTYGDVKAYFKGDSARFDDMKSAIKSSGDDYAAASVFTEKCVHVYGLGKTNAFLLSLKKTGPFAGIAGVIIAVIFFFVTKSRYKNMGKSGTYDLASNSKVDLKDVEDTFVTQHTTVRTIQKDNDNSSSPSKDGHSSGSF